MGVLRGDFKEEGLRHCRCSAPATSIKDVPRQDRLLIKKLEIASPAEVLVANT
ncbi:unnamed protein product [Rhodiola kirilowii]